MGELMQPAALRERIIEWAKEEEQLGGIMENSHRALAHILANRELERKDAAEVLGLDSRKARRVTAKLNERGIIAAATHKVRFRIAFPASLAPALLPGLYPKLNRQV